MNTTTPNTRTPNTAAHPVRVWAAVRDDLRERRQARREYRALAHDLASYTTRSDVDDLLAVLDDEKGTDAETIRTILSQNLQSRRNRHELAS